MSFLLTILILCLALINLSEAKHEKKLPSAVVVGTVYCDTCFQEKFSKPTHFISGASVAVECGGTSSRPSFYKEVKTDEHGEFKVSLPFSVTKHVKKIERCSVKLISSNVPYCSVASTATSSSLHLKSRKQGIHIFSAGFFTFRPLKQPELCTQKPSFKNTKESNSFQSSLPPTDNFPFPPVTLSGHPNIPLVPKKKRNSKNTNSIKTTQKPDQQEISYPVQQISLFPPLLPIPPNPFLPPPSILPPNPLLPPPSIFPPNPFQPSPPSILPPNPLLPPPSPPSLFPPNPFQPPSSPPSILPPNPFQPPSPPPSIFPPIPLPPLPPTPGIPPIPFLTPSPPPPPPPRVFPIPLPPLPLPPGFPGIPPASSSVKNSP